MSKRAKTSFQLHQEGLPDTSETNRKSRDFTEFKQLVLQWFIFDVIAVILIFFILKPSLSGILYYLAWTNLLLPLFTIAASLISGNTVVHTPAIYTGGTGAVEDMVDGRRRSNSFMLPFAIFTHGAVYYLIYLLFLFFGIWPLIGI